jgi:uncharacterized protein (DUF1499 family)
MSLLRWFTRNWADTDEPGDPALAPVDLPLSSPDTLDRLAAAVRSLPRWAVTSQDAAAGTLHATRRTRLYRFVDDVHVRLEPLPGGGTRVHARSKSRVGIGDFGQNRRNLLELFGALKRS